MPEPVEKKIINNETALKPVMPSQPPADVLGMTFDLEQLPVTSNDGPSLASETPSTVKQTSVETVKEEVKTDAAKPTEVKTDDKKPVEQKQEISKHLKPPTKPSDKSEEVKVEDKDKKSQVTVPKNDAFDYAGYSQEEVNHLKNMSIASRKYAGDLIKINKELAKQKDSNYLQHPQAYQLDPTYQAGLVDIQYANKEAQYWQKQLEQAKLGKPVKTLTGWDKNGNPLTGEEVASNDAVEETLRLNYQNAINTGNNIKNKLQEYPARYQKQIETDLGIINQTRGQIFEWNTKPELQDYTINIEGLGDRSIKQIKEDFRNLWPAYMRNHIAVDTAADFMVALRIRDSELAEARASKEVTDTKMEEVKRAEPSSTIRAAKELNEVHGIKEFDSVGLPDGL